MSTVLITGTSSGIGRLTAETLAAAGSVADEIKRILSLPAGQKPFRSVVDAANAGVDHVMAFSDLTREAFARRLGFAETLELKR